MKGDDVMTLKELRKSYNITQVEASNFLNIPLRTYKRYEQMDDDSNLKYQKMKELLIEKYEVTETKGILTIEAITKVVQNTLEEYKEKINFCFLFGSYAKGYAKENSDIDLIIDSEITGLDFFGLVEDLRETLHKKIDLLKFDQLTDNQQLLKEIMKDGIRIYKRHNQ